MKTDIKSQMNSENPEDVLRSLETKHGSLQPVGSAANVSILDGWRHERAMWYGVGTCFGAHGPVLAFGKWGVVGQTGKYRVLHPNGWLEETPTFKTELEAMLWVIAKTKPQKDQAQARREQH